VPNDFYHVGPFASPKASCHLPSHNWDQLFLCQDTSLWARCDKCLTKDNLIEEEIKKERIATGNRAFFVNQKIFQSKLIAKKTKIKLYKALIRPVVVYGSESWVLTENIKQKLLVFERKILRRIFGPTQKADGEWRLQTNEELENAIRYENIVRHMKSKRLSWLGHVERMSNERVPKIIYKWKPYATRPKGRPRLRWEDDVRNDLGSMGVENWKQKVQERKRLKDITEQAKTRKEL
jgi:hypothetical protein